LKLIKFEISLIERLVAKFNSFLSNENYLSSLNERLVRVDSDLRTYTPRFKIVVDQNKFVDDVMFYLTDPQLWVLSPSFQRQKL